MWNQEQWRTFIEAANNIAFSHLGLIYRWRWAWMLLPLVSVMILMICVNVTYTAVENVPFLLVPVVAFLFMGLLMGFYAAMGWWGRMKARAVVEDLAVHCASTSQATGLQWSVKSMAMPRGRIQVWLQCDLPSNAYPAQGIPAVHGSFDGYLFQQGQPVYGQVAPGAAVGTPLPAYGSAQVSYQPRGPAADDGASGSTQATEMDSLPLPGRAGACSTGRPGNSSNANGLPPVHLQPGRKDAQGLDWPA